MIYILIVDGKSDYDEYAPVSLFQFSGIELESCQIEQGCRNNKQ